MGVVFLYAHVVSGHRAPSRGPVPGVRSDRAVTDLLELLVGDGRGRIVPREQGAHGSEESVGGTLGAATELGLGHGTRRLDGQHELVAADFGGDLAAIRPGLGVSHTKNPPPSPNASCAPDMYG